MEGFVGKKIGVFGGTFNPPHLGHVTAARFALEALKLDRLFFIPAALPPHKSLPEGTPSSEHRAAMVSIAADNMMMPDQVEVSTLELSRIGVSYTADTLAQLQTEFPGAELWLLVGADMLRALSVWNRPEEIMGRARVAAFARSQSDQSEELSQVAATLETRYGARVRVLQLPEVKEISSTDLRARLEEGGGSEYLQLPVYGYLLRHGLYGTKEDLSHLEDDKLRACAYSMIRAKRIPHVQGTEEEAVRLALRWGADPQKARRAAILHDITKYFNMDEQLHLCADYGMVLDALEQKAVKLLHSKTGACIARAVYGADDEIFAAIYWHTTGKANMSLLEKIIYLSDYMEPTRVFPGVEHMRALAYSDLEAAVLMGCEMSIQEMSDRGLPVHHNTLEARDWLRTNETKSEAP